MCKFHVSKNHLVKLGFIALLSIATSLSLSAETLVEDSDGDGLSDSYEKKIGTEAYLSDTDGDGVDDAIEVGDNLNSPLDSDGDKRIDALDYDDDNDGLPTFLESKIDTDKDGIKDYLDTDSDNDGVADGKEAGALNLDKNLDGVDDAFDATRKGAVDKNGDGIDDNLILPDYNRDGVPDYQDASYQDRKDTIKQKKHANLKKEPVKKEVVKIVKTTKPQEKSVNKNPEDKKVKQVVNRYSDSDNDGLVDSLEIMLGTNPHNRDSDGDKVSDAIEIGLDINAPLNSDHDNLIDALDNDDDNDTILTKDEDINKDGTPINDDTDEDGVPNYLDANDDGDNQLTRNEGADKDTDNDGIPDYLDKNDGVKDEAPQLVTKEKVPEQPEVVVLFDGDEELLSDEIESEGEDEGTVETTITETLESVSLEKESIIKKEASTSSSKKVKQVASSWSWELF